MTNRCCIIIHNILSRHIRNSTIFSICGALFRIVCFLLSIPLLIWSNLTFPNRLIFVSIGYKLCLTPTASRLVQTYKNALPYLIARSITITRDFFATDNFIRKLLPTKQPDERNFLQYIHLLGTSKMREIIILVSYSQVKINCRVLLHTSII